MHFLKRGLRQGLWPLLQRYSVFPRALSLPPAPVAGDDRFGVHVRVCESDVMMLHWMLQSLLRVCSVPFDLMIHDDGSLSTTSATLLERQFPGATVLRRQEAALRILPMLEKHPRLRAWWPTTHRSIKWLDVYLLGESRHAVLLDSDIFFFSNPDELFRDEPRAVWMRDSSYMLYIQPEESVRLFGGHPLPQLNSGVGRIERSRFSLDLAEALLAHLKTPRDDQTLHAVMTAQRPDFALLPDTYDCATEPGLRGLICKHYTNPFRFMYYEEGIPRAAALLGMHLPPWLRERP